jgi:hypothetical protein
MVKQHPIGGVGDGVAAEQQVSRVG